MRCACIAEPSTAVRKVGIIFLVLAVAQAPLGASAAKDDPTHVEIDPIKFEIGPDGKIKTMAMDSAGNLLAGVSWTPEGSGSREVPASPGTRGFGEGSNRVPIDANPDGHIYAIKVIKPDNGEVIATWPMEDNLIPKMIHGCDDGTVYVGGNGKLAMFDAAGRRLKIIDTDEVYGAKGITSGLYADDKYVFIAFGFGNSMRATEDFYRFDRDLTNPKLIVEQQYGCCAHIDIEVRNGEVLIAENSRHRVNRFDLDGKYLGTWGGRDRTNIEGFAACCNPCNTDFCEGDGLLYTCESGVGRVKKYSQDGKYLGLVGYVDTTKFDQGSRLAAQSCYIPVEVNADGSRVYVMDVRAHFIRVLAGEGSGAGKPRGANTGGESGKKGSDLTDKRKFKGLDFFEKK